MLALTHAKHTHGGEHYAVSIGTLSWLVAVVISAAVLLGGMVLLNALVQRYWPQDVSWLVYCLIRHGVAENLPAL
jgi:hypothetical protein